jgi:ATP-dependent DNA helicase RecQ
MPAAEVSERQLLEVLRDRFGHAGFRPGQLRVIQSLLAQRDVLAVLPTGAGKSLVYQLTAQLLSGLTIVVSPLLALIKDQLDSLAELGLAARAISSLQSGTTIRQTLEAAERGETKLLYVTPERFDDGEFVARVQRIGVSLFVVDEAHSISDWGHSFRPAYLGLGTAVEQLARPPILALTATATQWVRQDVIRRLGMRDPVLVVRGTDRPNLFLEVVRVEEEQQDETVLHALLVGDLPDHRADSWRAVMQGSGIIYTATTRAAQQTATWLRNWGISAAHYHGKLKKDERERVQADFMDGRVRVIVATNAFGLGLDKPDVRFVIHRDVPASLEAYYQEAGRAGRDGNPARCVLVYRPGDLGRAAFLAANSHLTIEDIERGREGLLALGSGSVRALQDLTKLGRADLLRILELLKSGNIIAERRGRVRLLVKDFDATTISIERDEQRRAYERSRLDMMRGYAELRDCRRRYILNYFGEEPDQERCDNCDVDMRRLPASSKTPEKSTGLFAINDPVVHTTLGEGTIQRVAGDSVTVLFENAGYKMLSLDIVQEQQLLRKLS